MPMTLITENNPGGPPANYLIRTVHPETDVMSALKSAAADFTKTVKGKALMEETGGRLTMADLDLHVPEHVLRRHGVNFVQIERAEIPYDMDLLSEHAPRAAAPIDMLLTEKELDALESGIDGRRCQAAFAHTNDDVTVHVLVTHDIETADRAVADVTMMDAFGAHVWTERASHVSVHGLSVTADGLTYDVNFLPDVLLNRLRAAGLRTETLDHENVVTVPETPVSRRLVVQHAAARGRDAVAMGILPATDPNDVSNPGGERTIRIPLGFATEF